MEVSVPRQECKRSYSYVIGVPILPISTILILDFGIVPKTWYFIFVNHFYSKPQQVGTSMQIHFVYYICKQIQNIYYIFTPKGKVPTPSKKYTIAELKRAYNETIQLFVSSGMTQDTLLKTIRKLVDIQYERSWLSSFK